MVNPTDALLALDEHRLNELLDLWVEWFDPGGEEPRLYRDRAEVAKRAGKLAAADLILTADPLYADGGVMDFLVTNKVEM